MPGKQEEEKMFKQLIDEGFLREKGPYSNEEIIRAMAKLLMSESIISAEELYDKLFENLNMQLRGTINELDMQEMFEEIREMEANHA